MTWVVPKAVLLLAALFLPASAAIPDAVTTPGLKVTGQGDAIHFAPARQQTATASKGQPTGEVHLPSAVTTPRLTVTGQGSALDKPVNKPAASTND